MRTLLDGTEVPENVHPVDMTISSKCTQKWAFVDMETGDIWQWDPAHHRFRLASPKRVVTLVDAIMSYARDNVKVEPEEQEKTECG